MPPEDAGTATADPRQRLAELSQKGAELAKKGTRSADEMKELEGVLTEARQLKEVIAQNDQVAELVGFAGQSAGKLPVAAPSAPGATRATLESVTPAGSMKLENNPAKGTIDISENYGEGNFDTATLGATRTDAYRQAFRAYIRTPAGGHTKPEAMRALQEGVDAEGGFLVPEDFLAKIISREPTPTRVQARVTQLSTSRDALTIPKVIYTADDLYTTGIRVTWTNETVSAGSSSIRVTDPVFGQERIPVFTAMMSLAVSNDMIEDSAFALVDWVAGKFGETIDLLKDNMILNGTGQGQPAGILLNPGGDSNQPKIVVSGSASAVTADGLIATAMSLPEQYDNNAAWVFNKTSTGLAISQLKDTQNRYLWGLGVQQSGISGGFLNQPLVGYPVLLSGFMPNVGTSTFPAIFGDLTGYYLVNRIGFSVQILRELYAETNQILILGRIRFGGLVAEPWKLLVNETHT